MGLALPLCVIMMMAEVAAVTAYIVTRQADAAALRRHLAQHMLSHRSCSGVLMVKYESSSRARHSSCCSCATHEPISCGVCIVILCFPRKKEKKPIHFTLFVRVFAACLLCVRVNAKAK